jgi:predicted acylesterase/phospholipase RssA
MSSTDGGIVANVPVFPAVEQGCDTIVVIFLDSSASPTVNEIRESLDEQYRIQELARLSPNSARAMYGHFCDTEFPQLPISPYRLGHLVFVVPTHDLGLAVDFTGGRRARDLMELGEEDMKRVLSKI